MTFQEFDKFQTELFAEVVQMRDTKGKEYTDGVDRFNNFNEEAKDVGVDRLKVAEIFLNKHMRSIKSFIRTRKIHSTEPIRGRIVDAIAYLSLIAGMIHEDEQPPNIKPTIVASNMDSMSCYKCSRVFKSGESIYLGAAGSFAHTSCPKEQTDDRTQKDT